jgi:hypothetical protein
MKVKYKVYFDKVPTEASVSSLLNQEFERGEVDLLKIDADRNGVPYALLDVGSDIPLGYLKVIGDKELNVVSVTKY